jgi:hypothetical protein
MSENSSVVVASPAVKAHVEQASEVDVEKSGELLLKDRFDKEFQLKLNKLFRMKFKDESDLIARWPLSSSELSKEEGVYTWQAPGHNSYIVLTQDIIPDILASEWSTQPPATGRARFTTYLKQRYVGGPSQTQVTAFLEANDEHQIHRQRRRSQHTSTTVAQAPFKMIGMDLTDIPKRGVFRYLLVCVDLFSKYAWVTPLGEKSGPIVARELQKIIDSLPQGARVGAFRLDNGTGKSVTSLCNDVIHNTVCSKTNTMPMLSVCSIHHRIQEPRGACCAGENTNKASLWTRRQPTREWSRGEPESHSEGESIQ